LTLEVIDDDIVTLFWEKIFRISNMLLMKLSLLMRKIMSPPLSIRQKKRQMNPIILKAYEDALNESDTIKEFNSSLTDQDLHALLEEFEKYTQEKLGKLVYILFEMMYLADTRQDFEDISVFMMNSIDYAVLHGDINIATDILLRLKDLLEDKNISEEIKKFIKKILLFAGSEPVVIHLGELLDSGQDIDEKTFVAFVNFLDKNAIIPFMKMLGELKSIHARKMVIDALTYLGPKDILLLAADLTMHDGMWSET
jgi:hypothetical protein